MIAEVERLIENGVSKEILTFYGLEYKFIVQYLNGVLSLQEMEKQLTIAIQQFSKRQMTWFRKMERDGREIHWVNGEASVEEQLSVVLQILEQQSLLV